VAICDLDTARAAALAAEFKVDTVIAAYQTLLKQVPLDAVVVATPDFAHSQPVLACLAAGKHVLVEKPLTVDPGAGEAIVAAAARAGRHVMVNFGNRHRSSVRMLKQQMARQEFGRIGYAYMRLNEKLSKTLTLAWLERMSPIWFLTSHCTDLICWLLDTHVIDVTCTAMYGVLQGLGKNVPDGVVCTARLASGAMACFESIWTLPNSYPALADVRFDLVGSAGTVNVDFFPAGMLHSCMRAEVIDTSFVEWDHFLTCIREGRTPLITVDDGLAAVRIATAVQQAADTHQVVHLDGHQSGEISS
jgi:predicted dehydrogenase